MLQKIREKTTGWIAFVIVGILIIPFAFFGVNNYFESRVATWVAKIEVSPGFMGFGGDSREVSQDAFRQRHEQYRQQARQILGESYDARRYDTLEFKRQLLDAIVEEELLLIAAEVDGVVVTDAAVAREIASIPAFQVEGRFDPGQYRLLVQAQGFGVQEFERRMKQDLLRRRLSEQVARSSLISDADVENYLRLRGQRRTFSYLALAVGEVDEAVGEDELVEWHGRNANRFQSPETLAIEYVVVDADALDVQEEADERTLRDRFEEQRARFGAAEQRQASHILIEVPANAPASVESEARERAAALAAQAREGADFAELAREHSDDIGSRGFGGELGWIEQDGMLDAEFERALFELAQAGDVSEPVRSSDGWHVIRLAEVRAGETLSFDEAREQLAREWRETARERAFNEVAGRLLEASFRTPNDLAPAAEALGLELGVMASVTRASRDGLLAYPAVMAAIFEPDFIEQQAASGLIDLVPGRQAAIVRVAEHVPALPRPLDEVRDEAVAQIIAERRAEASRAQAEAMLARARAGEGLDALGAELGVEAVRVEGVDRQSGSFDSALMDRVFSLPRPGEDGPVFGIAELAVDSRFLVALETVEDGDPASMSESMRGMVRAQLGRAQSAIEGRAYIDSLRKRFPVRIAEERL